MTRQSHHSPVTSHQSQRGPFTPSLSRLHHDLSRQTQAPPSDARAERRRLHAPRLRREDLHAVRGLRPRFDQRRDRPGVLGARHRAASRRQALRHRLLVENARLLPRQLARLQQRARPHALRADRRESREPRSALHGRLGRRRLRFDRHRPVRACDPPRREHGLHRREQRRVRPHQGPVLRHGRQGLEIKARHRQHGRAARSDRDGAAARRDLRRPQLLRRQAAARAAHQGRDRAQGRCVHRRDLAVRRVQQPSGLDQELRVRARSTTRR